MFQADLLKDHDIAKTIKFGIALYLAMVLLATPAAICSLQHQVSLHKVCRPIVQSPTPAKLLRSHIVSPTAENAALLANFMEAAPIKSSPAPPFHYQIAQASQTYQVEEALIKAVIMAESGYNPRAVSHKGARGLMQLMPATAKWLGVHDSFDPAMNIDGGVRYLRKLLDRFNGDMQLALAAYNAGSRYVHQYGGVPPFRATRAYIKKVMRYRQIYLDQLTAVDGRPTSNLQVSRS
jgi:hypothetical protein